MKIMPFYNTLDPIRLIHRPECPGHPATGITVAPFILRLHILPTLNLAFRPSHVINIITIDSYATMAFLRQFSYKSIAVSSRIPVFITLSHSAAALALETPCEAHSRLRAAFAKA